MQVLSYILDKALILIPVLYVIGMILKGIQKIPNKYIPLILLPIGILGAIGLMGISVDAVIQGILVTGVAVYGNQLFKQLKKSEDTNNNEGDNGNE